MWGVPLQLNAAAPCSTRVSGSSQAVGVTNSKASGGWHCVWPRSSIPVLALVVVVIIVVACVVAGRIGGPLLTESQCSAAPLVAFPETPTSIGMDGQRRRNRTVHIQAVIVGDSLVSFSDYRDLNHLGGAWVETVDTILQRVLVGFVADETLTTQAQNVAKLWGAMLQNASSVFDDATWTSVLQRSGNMMRQRTPEREPPPSDNGDDKQRPEKVTTTIRSAHTAQFDLPGSTSTQIASMLEMCIAGHLLTFLPVCDTFMSSLQAGLQLAMRSKVDHVVFLVYFGAGTNNAFLVPGTWSTQVESQRLVTAIRNLVDFGLLGNSVAPFSGASTAWRARPSPPEVQQRSVASNINESISSPQWSKAGHAQPLPLFPFSFSGTRRAFVIGGELPLVWFFNNKSVPLKWEHVKPATATTSGQWQSWRNGAGSSSQQTLPSFSDVTSWVVNAHKKSRMSFPPAKDFCGFQQGLTQMGCEYVCSFATSDFSQRTLGAGQARLFEEYLRHSVSQWRNASMARQQSESAQRTPFAALISPTLLLPLRSLVATPACTPHGSAMYGLGGCLMSNPGARSNVRDCVHFTLSGSRKVALLLIQTFLSEYAALFSMDTGG